MPEINPDVPEEPFDQPDFSDPESFNVDDGPDAGLLGDDMEQSDFDNEPEGDELEVAEVIFFEHEKPVDYPEAEAADLEPVRAATKQELLDLIRTESSKRGILISADGADEIRVWYEPPGHEAYPLDGFASVAVNHGAAATSLQRFPQTNYRFFKAPDGYNIEKDQCIFTDPLILLPDGTDLNDITHEQAAEIGALVSGEIQANLNALPEERAMGLTFVSEPEAQRVIRMIQTAHRTRRQPPASGMFTMEEPIANFYDLPHPDDPVEE